MTALTSNVRPMSRDSLFSADEPAPRRPSLALSFSAWKVGDSNRLSYPIDVSGTTTLAEAVEAAQLRCQHKDVFHVLMRDDARGTGTLHIFVIKQKEARWVRNARGETVQVKPQFAHPLTSIEVSSFTPVEPFRWSPGADVVNGNETWRRNVVEQRP